MGNTLMSLLVRLGIDAGEVKKGLGDAETQTEKTAESMKSKFGKLGGDMTKLGGAMSVAFTAPIAILGKQTIEAASNLNESINAVNVVFEEGADIILRYGETSAMTVGLAKSEFNELATVTGAFLTNLGYNSDEAADKTIELTERAADMASVFNTDVSSALGAIQSGLKGEFNPLEQFGVKISAAAVSAKALEMGLADSTSELTESAKAQATLALVMEQTEKVAGDFANTSDELANSQRIMNAEMENAKAKLGEALLPTMTELTRVVTGLLTSFNELSPATRNVIVVFAGIIAAVGPLLLIVGQLIGAISTISGLFAAGGALAGVGAAISGLFGTLGAAAAGAGAAVLSAMLPILPIIAAVAAAVALLYLGWKNNWFGIRDTLNAVVKFMKSIVDAFLMALKGDWAGAGETLKAGWSAVWSLMTERFNSAISTIKGALSGFTSWTSSTWSSFVDGLKTFWSGAWDSIKATAENAWSSLRGGVSSLVNSIKSLFTNVDWNRIGKSIIEGIGNGISSMFGWVVKKAQEIASAISNAFSSFFDIGSPSRLMFYMGVNIMKGLSSGIAAQELKLDDTINSVTQSVNIEANVPSSGNVDSILGALGSYQSKDFDYARFGRAVRDAVLMATG